MEYEIEAVARALYLAEDDAQTWEHEPEITREEFRDDARTALALLAQHRRQEPHGKPTVSFPCAAPALVATPLVSLYGSGRQAPSLTP